jgi:large subunit ribosomal protein L13e
MKHNSALQSNHFKKTSLEFKTWFQQPIQQRIRKQKRQERAEKLFPNPIEKLRPVIRCPGLRYNGKERFGRGFSLVELQQAGLNPCYAQSIGIAVDARRYSKSEETIQTNVERLQKYVGMIKIYEDRNSALKDGAVQHRGAILPIEKKKPMIEAVPISQIESKVWAAEHLREMRRETLKRRAKKEKMGILRK